MKKYTFAACILFCVLAFISCAEFEGDQTIPAYIYIDKITVEPNPDIEYNKEQDSNFLHNDISVVDISVGGENMGVFTLPCKVPILKRGKHDLVIYPGVKQNGIAATRLPYYPFLERINIGQFDFVPGEVTTVDESLLKTRYITAAYYPMMEEFENSSTFDTVMKVGNDPNVAHWGSYYGSLSCPADRSFVESKTNQIFNITTNNQSAVYLYLEFDYKGNIPLYVGMLDADNARQIPVYAIRTKETEKWTKMYVVLGSIWKQLAYPNNFKIVLGATNPNAIANPNVYVDNVKILYIRTY